MTDLAKMCVLAGTVLCVSPMAYALLSINFDADTTACTIGDHERSWAWLGETNLPLEVCPTLRLADATASYLRADWAYVPTVAFSYKIAFQHTATLPEDRSLFLSIDMEVDDFWSTDTGCAPANTWPHTQDLIHRSWGSCSAPYITGLNVAFNGWKESSELYLQQRILARIDQ